MTAVTLTLSSGWKFKETRDPSDKAWLPVSKVPTVVHLDLIENGRIPDPFINMNELAARWVAEKSWTYSTTFDCPVGAGKGSRTDLVFKGLDTFATVTLNGHRILEADNMFLEYRVDVTDKLKASNDLEIVFDSALLRGYKLIEEHEHEHRFLTRTTDRGRLPVRKCQCHWGWDWGPILVTAGPWRPVVVETYSCRVEDVWFEAKLSDDLTKCSGKLFALTDVTGDKGSRRANVKFALSVNSKVVFESEKRIGDDGIATTSFELKDPKLWYPHGYGQQQRYELKASVIVDGSERSSQTKLVGFRKVQLIQEDDEFGKSFYFRVNDVDVFAGGSCWIPGDSFIPRIGREGYRKWMELMVEGNQIMLRIWGGGIYEEDALFDACDELGILVWQDFTFACGNYPAYPSFLKQIETEARYNVRRLRTHPSLVLWAGNNEDYQIQESFHLDYDYDGDKDPASWLKGSFPARYIYEYQLPKIVEEEDPGAVYHPGSPWGDGKTVSDRTVGDTHQWGMWHGAMRRYQELPTMGSRFISEFGMAAYPHLSTTLSAIPDPGQQHPGSMFMDYHNRATDHERRLLTYVGENLQLRYDLPSFTHLTQVTQADALDVAYRSWRRDWGTPGRRKTGGALVWQLNDCWPTVSWAVVDYHRVRKPAFHAIKRAMEPVVVGVSRPFYSWTGSHVDPTVAAKDTTHDVWVTSSRTDTVQGEVAVRFVSIKTGKDVVAPLERTVKIQGNATTDVIQQGKVAINFDYDNTKPFNYDTYDPYIIYTSLSINGTTLSTHTAWPHPMKYLDFSDRGVEVALSATMDKVTVTAKKPVHGFVFQERKDWLKFSDNGFDVIPGDERIVEISGAGMQKSELEWTYIGEDST